MTQYSRVKAILEEAEKPLTLHQIGKEVWKKFGLRDAETAISARVRDIRHDIHIDGKTILSERVSPKKQHHRYWIANLPNPNIGHPIDQR